MEAAICGWLAWWFGLCALTVTDVQTTTITATTTALTTATTTGRLSIGSHNTPLSSS